MIVAIQRTVLAACVLHLAGSVAASNPARAQAAAPGPAAATAPTTPPPPSALPGPPAAPPPTPAPGAPSATADVVPPASGAPAATPDVAPSVPAAAAAPDGAPSAPAPGAPAVQGGPPPAGYPGPYGAPAYPGPVYYPGYAGYPGYGVYPAPYGYQYPQPVAPAQPAAASVVATPGAEVDQQPLGLRLALSGEAALGVGTGSFTNALLGARLDWRASRTVAIGGYLGYANLKGKGERAHLLLPYGQVEYRRPLGASGALAWPIRFGSGYLARNGPMARLGTGLAFALGPHTALVAELASVAWMTHTQLLLSFDLGLAVELAL